MKIANVTLPLFALCAVTMPAQQTDASHDQHNNASACRGSLSGDESPAAYSSGHSAGNRQGGIGLCPSLYRYQAGGGTRGAAGTVLYCSLHRLAGIRRNQVRLVGRSQRAVHVPARSAPRDSRLGRRICGNARWRKAPPLCSLPARVWRARQTAGDSSEGRSDFRHRADFGQRYSSPTGAGRASASGATGHSAAIHTSAVDDTASAA